MSAATAEPAVTGTVRVTIAVPTYRRPDGLRTALPLLLDQARAVGDRYLADVLVVDNDPGGSGAAVVAELAAPELRYVGEPTPGIAAVRNRAIDEAGDSRLLVFIDDDERPMPAWLTSLLGTWEATGATAVAGRIVAEFAGEPDPWLRAGDFWRRPSMPSGTPVDVVATGSLLLDLEHLRRAGVRFSAELGLGGGEDTLFSHVLARAGGRMVWCDESVAVDAVPPDRMTRSWIVTRMCSQGNTTVLVQLRLAGSGWARASVRARGVAGGLLRLAVGAGRCALGELVGSDRHRARGLRVACRGAGMVAGGCGVAFHEYARDGRRWRPAWGGAR